jgi:flagellar basal-body rod protein FlgF
LDDALITATQALRSGMERMSAISQNLVNASTPGYRRVVPLARGFDGTLAEAARTHGIETAVDARAGAPMRTGRPLDLAIDGDGWFELSGPQGTGYTRHGSFRLAADGRIVNEAGFALMGSGGPIVVDGTEVSIAADGEVLQRGRRPAGQVKTVRLDGAALVKGNDGLMRLARGEAQSPAERPRLKVGHLEGSNVSVPREMTELMQTMRSFEAMQRVMQAYDEQLGSAIQKLTEF